MPNYLQYAYTGAAGNPCFLYSPADRTQFLAEFRQFSASTPPPLSVQKFESVILAGERRAACLYTLDGEPIEPSRMPPQHPREAQQAPNLFTSQPDLDVKSLETIEPPLLFQSVFVYHYGHFLLESLARAWVFALDPSLAELPTLYAWPLKLKFVGSPYTDIWQHLGVRLQHRNTHTVRLRQCYVPSITLSLSLHNFAHKDHLKAPHQVASRLLKNPKHEPRPVYLSRRLVPIGSVRRHFVNELTLEETLKSHGIETLHMQTLSLAEQITIMNSYSGFISPWGSALHNILFSLNGPTISTFVLIGENNPFNYFLLDNIVGNTAHYLNVLQFVEIVDDVPHIRIDINAVITYLKLCGIL